MAQPLLDLEQDWHRQRASLRASHQRPPPLVTAGLDLASDAQAPGGRRIAVAGMALIFGIFPATVAEFVDLARSRLRLGSDAQRAELAGILANRIQALWAWLPTLAQDCYLELDHATGIGRMWLIGPGPGDARAIELDGEHRALDEAFLSALVITSTKHWGGHDGLARLVERFGRRPLLIAAQVAEALERDEVPEALACARQRWPGLDERDEARWEPIAEEEQAWVCVQLGRLALRLGLVRAARLLLGQARFGDVSPVAWFDLGQACEALDDLSGAEAAFTRYGGFQGDDPDGWRRALFCRLRLGQLRDADIALKRFRAAGGADAVLVERLVNLLEHVPLPDGQRPRLVGWLGSRLAVAMRKKLSLRSLIGELRGEDESLATAFDGAWRKLRAAVRAAVPLRAASEPDQPALPNERAIDAVLRLSLLCLPFYGPDRPSSVAVAETYVAFAQWARFESEPYGLDTPALRGALTMLARIARARD